MARPVVLVRPFRAEDAPGLSALLIEMASFYGAEVDAHLDVKADVVRRAQEMDILVAERGAHLVGFATFTSLYPLGRLTQFTYLQQVYVAAQARRSGIAEQLLVGVAKAAIGRGSTRLEWTTSDDNHAAHALYESVGAIGTSKRAYALDGHTLSALATKSGA